MTKQMHGMRHLPRQQGKGLRDPASADLEVQAASSSSSQPRTEVFLLLPWRCFSSWRYSSSVRCGDRSMPCELHPTHTAARLGLLLQGVNL